MRRLERGIAANELPRVWANDPASQPRVRAVVARDDRVRLGALLRSPTRVLIVGAHAGPRFVVPELIRTERPDAVVLSANPEHWRHDERTAVASGRTTRAELLRLRYVEAFTALRNGGVAYASPDGGLGENLDDAVVLGVGVRLSRAIAALARLTGATSVPVAPVWRRGAVRLVVGDPLDPTHITDDTGWERAWLEGYAAWLEGVYRSDAMTWRIPTGVTAAFFEPDARIMEWRRTYNRRIAALRDGAT